jgi:hypothetical protein
MNVIVDHSPRAVIGEGLATRSVDLDGDRGFKPGCLEAIVKSTYSGEEADSSKLPPVAHLIILALPLLDSNAAGRGFRGKHGHG